MYRKIIFLVLILSVPLSIFAYNNTTTHPALTSEVVNLYNSHFGNTITDEEKQWIINGSIYEDAPPRWINHFYDPVNNVGWTGEGSGSIPTELMQKFSDVFLSNEKPLSAPDWAQNQEMQAKYKDYEGNQTWEAAIYDFVKNKNKKDVYYALGHILHLLEDMAVPDHTRNDTHYPTNESPYENYASQYNLNNFHITETLKNQTLPAFNSLNDYFNYLANYSNKYFFSRDTVPEENKDVFSKYPDGAVIIEDSGEYVYGRDKNNSKIVLAMVSKKRVQENNFFKEIKTYTLSETEPYNLIYEDYFTHLSREAVLAGAGVINLFFQEVAKAEADPSLLKEPPKNQAAIISVYGEFVRAKTFIAGAADKVKNSIVFIFQQIAAIGNIFSNQEPAAPASISESTYDVDSSNEPTPGVGETTVSSPPQSKPPPTSQTPPTPSISESTSYVNSAPVVVTLPPVKSSTFDRPTTVVTNRPIPFPGSGGSAATPPSASTVVVSTPPEPPPSLSPSPPADTTPPDVSLLVSECQNSLAAEGCLLATTTLNILWSSAATDLDYFELNLNNSISTTTATSTTVVVLDNSINIFAIMAKDIAGNWSASTTKSVEISSMPVVINEIAWAGTGSQTSADEWIEFYNRTNYDINLDGWVLYSQTDNTPYINLSGTIPANGYYLLERTDDNTISDILANQIYTGGLNNTGEVLILSYASTTIDQTVLCGAGPIQWCPGFDYKYRTMERYDPDLPGTDQNSWGYNNLIVKNGKDVEGQPINGTPKARNSVNYLIAKGASQIDSDITLTKSRSPYLVNNTIQVFQASSTLFIEPGVVIKFANNSGLGFSGGAVIKALGTEAEPVVFTAINDDEKPEWDIDGSISTSTPGSWYGILIESSNNESVFDNVIFRYGGWYYYGLGQPASLLTIQNSSVNISNSIFEYSLVSGLKLINSNSIVSNNIFRNNNQGQDLAGYDSGVLVLGGNPTIQNNQFLTNHRGIFLSSLGSVLDSNIFQSNTNAAIYSAGPMGSLSNNSGSGNAVDGIYLASENITQTNTTTTLKSNPLSYVFDGNLTIPANSSLVIEPGVVMKGDGGYWGGRLNVYGSLSVSGINPSDIIFTSNSLNPSAGNWQGVFAYPGSSVNIKGATFSYAETAISYQGPAIKLENVKFENNNLAISADEISATQTITAILIEFLNNTATTSPSLW